jgi:hypothetical protein
MDVMNLKFVMATTVLTPPSTPLKDLPVELVMGVRLEAQVRPLLP